MAEKQYITMKQASKYSGVSQDLIRTWIKQELLSELYAGTSRLIDPDELDALLEFREKVRSSLMLYTDTTIYRSDRPWTTSWKEHKDALLKLRKPIPTFVDNSKERIQFAVYRRKDGSPVQIRALFFKDPFRIISDTYAMKTDKPSFLIKLVKQGKSYLRYMAESEFLQYFERVPIEPTKNEKEEEIIDYIFSNDEFREKVKMLLIQEDEKEMHLLDEMVQEEKYERS